MERIEEEKIKAVTDKKELNNLFKQYDDIVDLFNCNVQSKEKPLQEATQIGLRKYFKEFINFFARNQCFIIKFNDQLINARKEVELCFTLPYHLKEEIINFVSRIMKIYQKYLGIEGIYLHKNEFIWIDQIEKFKDDLEKYTQKLNDNIKAFEILNLNEKFKYRFQSIFALKLWILTSGQQLFSLDKDLFFSEFNKLVSDFDSKVIDYLLWKIHLIPYLIEKNFISATKWDHFYNNIWGKLEERIKLYNKSPKLWISMQNSTSTDESIFKHLEDNTGKNWKKTIETSFDKSKLESSLDRIVDMEESEYYSQNIEKNRILIKELEIQKSSNIDIYKKNQEEIFELGKEELIFEDKKHLYAFTSEKEQFMAQSMCIPPDFSIQPFDSVKFEEEKKKEANKKCIELNRPATIVEGRKLVIKLSRYSEEIEKGKKPFELLTH